jgi:hypothetical protein
VLRQILGQLEGGAGSGGVDGAELVLNSSMCGTAREP